MKKVIVTGGSGRFGKVLQKGKTKFKMFFPSKSKLNVENYITIEKYIKKINPDYFIHCAAISRPMELHDKDIQRSISTNIIGTCNVVNACKKHNLKLIYFSTNYVYPSKPGTYSETDPVLPINNYAWSKLGGECAVHMYKNSLILRVCMTERPFIHTRAFSNVISNFLFHDEVAKILLRILNYNGVLNIGSKATSVYSFAKKNNSKVKKIRCKLKNIPLNQVMNIAKLKKILNHNS